jgi:hypothetical protein
MEAGMTQSEPASLPDKGVDRPIAPCAHPALESALLMREEVIMHPNLLAWPPAGLGLLG